MTLVTTQVDELLQRLDQAAAGLHYINGELIEFSRENQNIAPYIVGRLLSIADKFATAAEAGDQAATLPWSVALTAIVNVRGDKAGQMERIESAIIRFSKAADLHETEAYMGVELANDWMHELKTRQSIYAPA